MPEEKVEYGLFPPGLTPEELRTRLGKCDCKVTGGYPTGFTVSCDSNEARNALVIRLINTLPRFVKLGAGTKDSLIVEHERIEKEGDFELEVVGHLITAGACWEALEKRQGGLVAEKARRLAREKTHDPMKDGIP